MLTDVMKAGTEVIISEHFIDSELKYILKHEYISTDIVMCLPTREYGKPLLVLEGPRTKP